MNDFISILLATATLALQYFLSYRNSAYLGAIVPTIFIVVLTWLFYTGEVKNFLAYILILAVGLIFLLEQWSRGRKTLSKNRQKELDKMKTHDIN